MLKGIIKLYTFVVNDNRDLDEINNKLKEIFYTDYSPVKQFLDKKNKREICYNIYKKYKQF